MVPPESDPAPLDPLALTSDEFVRAAEAFGVRPGQASRAYTQAHRLGPGAAGVIGRAAARAISLPGPTITRSETEPTDEGATTKFCLAVDRPTTGPIARDERVGSLDTESVIIPMIGSRGHRTYTLCVSSQIGCAMGCDFCETAQMGLVRNLTASEIVAQWHAATFHSIDPRPELDHRPSPAPISANAKRHIKNIVFMGMGEPMDNYDEVEQAIRVLSDRLGPGIGPSCITVSTVGRLDGIERYARLVREPGFHKLGLAISVNAPNDEIRSRIMPVNRSAPMAELREALLAFPYRARNKFCFEYVLIPGVNDAPEHAAELAEYLAPFNGSPESPVPRGLLNLIPYNPRRNSPWPAPTEEQTEAFMGWLIAEGVFVKRRRTKGRSQMAACGQLGSERIRRREYIDLGLATPPQEGPACSSGSAPIPGSRSPSTSRS